MLLHHWVHIWVVAEWWQSIGLRIGLKVEVTLILSRQSEVWIVSRGDNFRLHMKECNHALEVEVFGLCALNILAHAIEQAFKCKPLRAVHIQCLAEAHEAIFSDWQGYLVVLEGFVNLLGHVLELTLIALQTFLCRSCVMSTSA